MKTQCQMYEYQAKKGDEIRVNDQTYSFKDDGKYFIRIPVSDGVRITLTDRRGTHEMGIKEFSSIATILNREARRAMKMKRV